MRRLAARHLSYRSSCRRPILLLAGPAQAFFAYCTNYLIDLKNAVIMDVEASTAARQAELTAARRMIDRVQGRFEVWPARLAADTSYGSAETWHGWSMRKGSSRTFRYPAIMIAAEGCLD